jgi:biotin operon repressor
MEGRTQKKASAELNARAYAQSLEKSDEEELAQSLFLHEGLRKHFRYRKVTPELLEFMKLLKSYQLSYGQIGDACGLSRTTVQYHLNIRQRELTIERAKHHYQKPKTKKYYAKKRASPQHRSWMREYLRERYRGDPEFRAKILRANRGGRFADGENVEFALKRTALD